MKHIFVAPSLLACDFSRLKEEIKAVERAGADMLHIDVMDGRFVPNITVGQPVVSSIKRITALPLDIHLMILEPMDHIKSFIDSGADIITIHWEACNHIHKAIGMIRDYGAKPGVSLNPATPVSMLKNILGELYLAIIMTVNPGFGGQKFISSALNKIKELSEIKKNTHTNVLIEVDGGINPGNAGIVTDAGADILVAGTSIFGAKDYRSAILSMKGVKVKHPR